MLPFCNHQYICANPLDSDHNRKTCGSCSTCLRRLNVRELPGLAGKSVKGAQSALNRMMEYLERARRLYVATKSSIPSRKYQCKSRCRLSSVLRTAMFDNKSCRRACPRNTAAHCVKPQSKICFPKLNPFVFCKPQCAILTATIAASPSPHMQGISPLPAFVLRSSSKLSSEARRRFALPMTTVACCIYASAEKELVHFIVVQCTALDRVWTSPGLQTASAWAGLNFNYRRSGDA